MRNELQGLASFGVYDQLNLVRANIADVMFDRPYRVKTQFIGISDLFQSLVKPLLHSPGDVGILCG